MTAPDSEERKRRWDELYRGRDVETLPWFYPGLDPDFAAALEERDLAPGSAVLDLCTGPGTQALAMAERGFSVTAMDIADTAVGQACLEARKQGLDITFRQNDILDNRLEQPFDLVLDRGCYHVFPLERRRQYVPAVAGMLKTGGFLFLKCFSNRETRPEGPYRISPQEIERLFPPLFEVMAIRHTVFQNVNREPEPKALFCVMRRSLMEHREEPNE